MLERENGQLSGLAGEFNQTPLKEILVTLLETEQADLLCYSTNEDSFILPYPDPSLNVLWKIPMNMDELVDMVHSDEQENFKAAFGKLQNKSSVRYPVKIHLQKDEIKATKPVEFAFIKSDETNIIIIITDITDITRQQRELIKVKEKVEESDKLKATLLSNISHQIRTPLNSITGFSELLAGTEANQLKRKEYIEIIKQQSKRILNLIDDISEISKLEAGSINISKTNCNLQLILNEILLGLNQQRTSSRKELVELELEVPEKGEFEILTDSGRLQQVLLNILNYSLRHTPQGKIKFGYSIDHENSKVQFFIHDTSDGLTKEEQKVVFNKFMVIENAENTKLEEPGLGLTIAREIVKAMGGKIWVESEKNKGTSFFFNIPFEQVPKMEPIETEEEINPGDNYTWSNKVILIVEDEDVNAMFLDAVFQGSGAQLLFAKNGLQALELIKTINKIDLILMDLKMPVMNGLKATAEIRKFNKSVPIIAQTALASEEDRHESEQAGCNNIITKPIEVEELLQMVDSYISD